MDQVLFLATLWAIGLLVAYLTLPYLLRRWKSSASSSIGWFVVLIVGVALIVRLVPNFLLPVGAGFDIESYQIVGRMVLDHKDVYASVETLDRHPYLPLQMYWLGLAVWLADATGILFVKIVRLLPIAADAAIALALFLYLRRSIPLKDAFLAGLLYACNPIPVFVSAYHGQFDALPMLVLMLAIMMNSPSAGFWMGLGILVKSWPVLGLPSLLHGIPGWKGRSLFLAMVVAVPLTGIGAYALVFHTTTFAPMLTYVLGYNHGIGAWGYAYLAQLLSMLVPHWDGVFSLVIQYGKYLTLGALGLVWLVCARQQSPAAGILTILVAFFAFTHAFSIQYLVWLIPFALLNREYKWLQLYTVAAFVYMLWTYMTLILDMRVTQWMLWPQADWFLIRPTAVPVWLVTVLWIVERLRTTAVGSLGVQSSR
jgi:Glycosyltransferase family 87